MPYRVTKTYGHEQGLSACFRQCRAESHCRFLHGYALSFSFTFEARHDLLDENGWVLNFGALRPLKEQLTRCYDHRTLVAEDDPELPRFFKMRDAGIIDLFIMPRVGCEAFAKHAAMLALDLLEMAGHARVRLIEVTCAEHGANSATYIHSDQGA